MLGVGAVAAEIELPFRRELRAVRHSDRDFFPRRRRLRVVEELQDGAAARLVGGGGDRGDGTFPAVDVPSLRGRWFELHVVREIERDLVHGRRRRMMHHHLVAPRAGVPGDDDVGEVLQHAVAGDPGERAFEVRQAFGRRPQRDRLVLHAAVDGRVEHLDFRRNLACHRHADVQPASRQQRGVPWSDFLDYGPRDGAGFGERQHAPQGARDFLRRQERVTAE